MAPTDAAIAAAEIAARAYIALNPTATALEAIGVLSSMYAAMSTVPSVGPNEVLIEPCSAEEAVVEEAESSPAVEPTPSYTPAMPIHESISADGEYIFCLVDGKRLRMLKRYIKRFGMTPATYRAAFGLPENYPMTAPAYSDLKRIDAEHVGLGRSENKAGVNMNLGRQLQAA